MFRAGYLRSEDHARGFHRCLSRKRPVGQCQGRLADSCHNATMVVIKTIRTPLYVVADLLAALPRLKVIYYTRDPRGTINSRVPGTTWMSKKFHGQRFLIAAANLCDRLRADFAHFSLLSELYRGRILHLRYETLARAPAETAHFLYDFLDRETPERVLFWISRNTQTDVGGLSSTTRNSSATSSKWTWQIRSDLLQKLNSQCGDVLRLLGYTVAV